MGSSNLSTSWPWNAESILPSTAAGAPSSRRKDALMPPICEGTIGGLACMMTQDVASMSTSTRMDS